MSPFVDKATWPKTEAIYVRRETDVEGERFLLEGGRWPEHIEVAGELFQDLRCDEQFVWFTLHNGAAQYRLVERDDATNVTLCTLVEGVVL